MLSAARVCTRAALSSRRASFATAVETSGFKVAAVDNGQPTSAVTFLVKAGSRFESKPGVAHALKNFAFKNTAQRSALRTVREAELHGGVLSSSLTREHLAITAEFLRGDEAFFVELLSSLLTSTKFTTHEFHESVLPIVQAESAEASSDPTTLALDLAHALAFRSGLGTSLFASPHGSPISSQDIKEFASTAFSKGNIAVFGTGINQATLSQLVEKHLASAPGAPAITPSPTKYFGGETRVASTGHGPQTVFIGFGTASPASAELATLSSHLNPVSSVKWTDGTSPLAGKLPAGTTVQSVLLPYSDASLFGLLIQGTDPAAVKEAGKLAVAALKGAGSLTGDDLKKAVAKAKFGAANAIEGREGLLNAVAPTLLSGTQASLDSTFSALDKVTASTFSKAVSSVTGVKPTYVVVGDINALPYADELGL